MRFVQLGEKHACWNGGPSGTWRIGPLVNLSTAEQHSSMRQQQRDNYFHICSVPANIPAMRHVGHEVCVYHPDNINVTQWYCRQRFAPKNTVTYSEFSCMMVFCCTHLHAWIKAGTMSMNIGIQHMTRNRNSTALFVAKRNRSRPVSLAMKK